MATYTICDKCKKFVEYLPAIKTENGTVNKVIVCSKCGYVKHTSINHIHYGDDEKK